MPLGDVSPFYLLLEARERGFREAEQRVRGLAGAMQQVQASSRTMAQAVFSANHAIDSATRTAFRYTYYGLIAIRAGQMMLAAGLRRFFVEPAREAEEAIVRFAALSDEARSHMEQITQAAVEFAMKTPFAITDAAQAMETLYRTGRSVEQAMEEAEYAAYLAVISGRDLVTEARFLGEVLGVFGRQGLTAAQAVDELAYAMTQSKYTVAELQAALENGMDAALGFNQSFEQTLTLLTALGRAGVPARQAGTMIRRIFARMGMPKVQEFFETFTEMWNEMNASAIEAGKTMEVTLYTAEGGFGDLTRAVVATAEVMERLREQATQEGWGAEFARGLQQLLYQVFGIRQIRTFLSLANFEYMGKKGVEAYDLLLKKIREATGYAKEYRDELMKTYSIARLQFQSTLNYFRVVFGTPMIQFLNPALRIITEMVNAMARLGTYVPTFRDLVATIGVLVSYMGMFAGAIGVAWGTLKLLQVRLIDIGEQIQALVRAGYAFPHLLRGLTREKVMMMSPLEVGKRMILGGIISPLRTALALVTLIGVGVLAWKKNLGGLRDKLSEPFERLQETLVNTGTLGTRWAEKIKEVFTETPAWRAFWGGGFGQGPHQAGPGAGSFWNALNTQVSTFMALFAGGLRVLTYAAKGFWAVVRGVFAGLAWVIGLGDTERGFRRLGAVIGWLASWGVLGLAIWSIVRLGKAIWWLGTKALGTTRRIMVVATRAVDLGLSMATRLFIKAPLLFIQYLLDIPQHGFRPAMRSFLREAFGLIFPSLTREHLRSSLKALFGRLFRDKKLLHEFFPRLSKTFRELVHAVRTIRYLWEELARDRPALRAVGRVVSLLFRPIKLLLSIPARVLRWARDKAPDAGRLTQRFLVWVTRRVFLPMLLLPLKALLLPLRVAAQEYAQEGRIAWWAGLISKRLFEWLYGRKFPGFGRDWQGRFRRTSRWERFLYFAFHHPLEGVKLLWERLFKKTRMLSKVSRTVGEAFRVAKETLREPFGVYLEFWSLLGKGIRFLAISSANKLKQVLQVVKETLEGPLYEFARFYFLLFRSFCYLTARAFRATGRALRTAKEILKEPLRIYLEFWSLLGRSIWFFAVTSINKLKRVLRVMKETLESPFYEFTRFYFLLFRSLGRGLGLLVKKSKNLLRRIARGFSGGGREQVRIVVDFSRSLFFRPLFKLLSNIASKLTSILRLQTVLVLLRKKEFWQNIGSKIWDTLKGLWNWLVGFGQTLLVLLGLKKLGGLNIPGGGKGSPIDTAAKAGGISYLVKKTIDLFKRTPAGKGLEEAGKKVTGFGSWFYRYVIRPVGTAFAWLARRMAGLPGLIGGLGALLIPFRAEAPGIGQLVLPQSPFAAAGQPLNFTGPATERPSITIQNLSVALSPTIELKEGTTVEQARQLVEMVRAQLASTLKDLQDGQLELHMRGAENPLEYSGLSLSFSPAGEVPYWLLKEGK